jgi:hypothetical protein
MTNISQTAKETQIWHMKEAHHPKMQYDTNATCFMTRWLSYHGLYIKQSMYIHQSKTWYDTYDIKRKSPKNQLERATNPKFPPQAHKCSLVERLCKDVG